MIEKSCPTIRIDIFMAGDVAVAKQECRHYCYDVGLCVHVERATYIYTGGEEQGFRVGLINYPRFPATETELFAKAKCLADRLLKRLAQHSYSISSPSDTLWVTRRES